MTRIKNLCFIFIVIMISSCQVSSPDPSGQIPIDTRNEMIDSAIFFDTNGNGSDNFGYSVDISGDGKTAVCGGYWADITGVNSGGIYIYEWKNQSWEMTNMGPSSGSMGYDVAVSDDGRTVAAGAGEIIVYKKINQKWIESAVFTNLTGYTIHGSTLDISDDGNVIVANIIQQTTQWLKIIIYTWNGQEWTYQVLSPAFTHVINNMFSCKVAISGDGNTVLASSYTYHSQNGMINFFSYISNQWTFTHAKLGSNGEGLGTSIDINYDGSIAVAGSVFGHIDTSIQGLVHVFKIKNGTWKIVHSLTHPNPMPGDALGVSVAISDDGNSIFAGATGVDEKGDASGAIFKFDWTGELWTPWEITKIIPDAISTNYCFGCDVATDSTGSRIIAGVRYGQHSGTESGSAYYLQWDGGSWK